MSDGIKWSVVLACPGVDDLSLLAELSARLDARIVAVADPDGHSIGAEIAEIMGLPVVDSLEGLNPNSIDYLVHGPLRAPVALLVDEARDLGIETLRSEDFSARLLSPLPPRALGAAAPSEPALDHLERETAAIHRTLSRIEEALDRESLLRWLLNLGMRAVGATSGSLLLLDEASRELYVGFDHGLSESTRQSTRIALGEGIAGRVAASGRAERIRERGSDPGRDRADIVDAVCAPIIWDDRLLGVLNISSSAADGLLCESALGLITGLTHRLGMILDRFLQLQSVQNSARFRDLDARLGTVTPPSDDTVAGLGARIEAFRTVAGAGQARLGLLTADGDLCLVGEARVSYESPLSAEHAAVLTGGTPRVVRDADGRTVFHLPLRGTAERAVLSLTFASAAAANDFSSRCGDFVYLANRHLGHAIDLAARAEELVRMTALASALSSLAEVRSGDGAEERALATVCRLTGAERTLVIDGRDSMPETGPDAVLRTEAARLLRDTGEQEWRATTLQTDALPGSPTRSVLAVPLEPHQPLPGLLLVDKRRVHPLDAAVFTETDAEFARRLLPLLKSGETAVEFEVPSAPTNLLNRLRREMDRCDRYHTMLGVAAFRLDDGAGAAPRASSLGAHLRSSDEVGCLDDGTLIVLVPEDIQSLPRLQRRVGDLLRILAGEDATVSSSTAVYPGPAEDAAQLLAAATRNLS